MLSSLKGRCLVAASHLRDPNFHKTVVLLLEHNAEGSMGLVINRPSSIQVTHALAEHFSVPDLQDVVYVGGPVETSALFIMHDGLELSEAAGAVINGVYLGNSAEVFEEVVRQVAAGTPRLHFRVYSGYSGWGAGQLEEELARGDWHPLPSQREWIFETDPYELYDTLLKQIFELNRLVPKACQNPDWN